MPTATLATDPRPAIPPAWGKLASGPRSLLAWSDASESSDLAVFSWQGRDSLHARYYNPNVARFLSTDPAGSDPKKPQTWNRYTYVLNNPVNMTDPDGKLALVFTVGPGSDLFEKAGHSAVFVVSPTGDSAGMSFGGNHDFSKGVGAFVKAYNAEGRTVSLSVLSTSPAQDAKMIDFLRSNPDGATNREAVGADAMLRENCAQAVGNTLEAGGVFSPGSNPSQVLGGALSLPGQLAQQVQGLGINLGTIVLKPDTSRERENFLQFVLDVGPPAPVR